MPREVATEAPFLSHPPPLSDGNLHPAALLRMRGNYFRPNLSISACAIEVQHSNENSTTIRRLKRITWAQEGGSVSRVNRSTHHYQCDVTSHIYVFQNGGQFSCSLFLQKMIIFWRSGNFFCLARMSKHLKNRKE